MTGMLEQIDGVIFDAYGTLFDVFSVNQLAEQYFPQQASALTVLWRDKQLEYSRLRSMMGRYESFWEITRSALEFSVRALHLNASGQQIDQLMACYRALEVFPDVIPCLQKLHDEHRSVGILTNGNRAMVRSAIEHANLTPMIQWVLSSEDVQRFKPDPAIYALGPRAFKTSAARLLFVTANGWDASCATLYGYNVFWVNRQNKPNEMLGTKPRFIGSSLHELIP
jgi:2-haloacid dehalogenase